VGRRTRRATSRHESAPDHRPRPRQIVANAGEDAASEAGLLLKTEVMVAESPKDDEQRQQ
jgi:hypothetical protein